MKHKRGMSPVISAVLLITLTLAIAGIVFVWMKNATEKAGKEGEDILCREIVYAIGDVCHIDESSLGFNANNYAQNLSLNGFTVKAEAEGESKSFLSDSIEIAPSNSGQVLVSMNENIGEISKIHIIPRIKSGQAIVDCAEKETIRVWSEIPECD